MPQLDISTYPSQLFWLGLTFFFLWGFLHSWVVPRFVQIFAKRQAHLETLLQKATVLQNHAKHLNKQADQRLAYVKTQAEQLIHQTLQEVEQEKVRQQEAHLRWLRQEREEAQQAFDATKAKALESFPLYVPDLGKALFHHISDKKETFTDPKTSGKH